MNLTKEDFFIFDMDGTLYKFDGDKNITFGKSRFYMDLKEKIYSFLMKNLSLEYGNAKEEYERILSVYRGNTSEGIEDSHGIPRRVFFDNTWDLEPKKYVIVDKSVQRLFQSLEGRTAILTAAPKNWAVNVLKHLQIYDFVKDNLYTCDDDLRKPNPKVFEKIAKDFGVETSQVISVGDQEYSDIIPAKKAGLRTIYVGVGETSADLTIEELVNLFNYLKC